MIRTTEKTVIFRLPFRINGFNDPFPAGVYRVETDEELLESLSFRAYRRVQTVLQLPAEPGHPGLRHSLAVDAKELDAALERDRAPTPESGHGSATAPTEELGSRADTADRQARKRSATRARNRVTSSGPGRYFA